MQKLIAAIAVASVLATSALAQDSAPLPAGRPSGVAKAQGILDNTPLLVVGGIVVLVGVGHQQFYLNRRRHHARQHHHKLNRIQPRARTQGRWTA
jgi:hypothetical protein